MCIELIRTLYGACMLIYVCDTDGELIFATAWLLYLDFNTLNYIYRNLRETWSNVNHIF